MQLYCQWWEVSESPITLTLDTFHEFNLYSHVWLQDMHAVWQHHFLLFSLISLFICLNL